MVAAPHRPTCTPSQKTPELCEGSGKPDGRPSIEIYAGHHDKPSLTAAPISAGRQHRIALSGRGWRLERLGGVCPEIRDDTHGHNGPELRNQRVSVAIVFHEPEVSRIAEEMKRRRSCHHCRVIRLSSRQVHRLGSKSERGLPRRSDGVLGAKGQSAMTGGHRRSRRRNLNKLLKE